MYAAVIESEFDHAQVAEALGSVTAGGETASAMANSILAAMAEYHSVTVRLDGVKIPHLYPGEGFVISCAIFPGTAVFGFLRLAGKNCTRGIVSSEHPGLGLPSSKSR